MFVLFARDCAPHSSFVLTVRPTLRNEGGDSLIGRRATMDEDALPPPRLHPFAFAQAEAIASACRCSCGCPVSSTRRHCCRSEVVRYLPTDVAVVVEVEVHEVQQPVDVGQYALKELVPIEVEKLEVHEATDG